MAKITIYLLILSCVILLFGAAGLSKGTGTWFMMNSMGLGDPENMTGSYFYTSIIEILGLGLIGVAGSIVLSILTKSDITTTLTYISRGFAAGLLAGIASDLIGIYLILKQTNTTIAGLIILPLLLVFIFAVYNWFWGGKE